MILVCALHFTVTATCLLWTRETPGLIQNCYAPLVWYSFSSQIISTVSEHLYSFNLITNGTFSTLMLKWINKIKSNLIMFKQIRLKKQMYSWKIYSSIIYLVILQYTVLTLQKYLHTIFNYYFSVHIPELKSLYVDITTFRDYELPFYVW